MSSHVRIEARGPQRLEKPVTAIGTDEVWSLFFVLVGHAAVANEAKKLFKDADKSAVTTLEFVGLWQKLLGLIPVGAPLDAHSTTQIQRLVDWLEFHRDPGIRTRLLLPCRNCRHVFEAPLRAFKYRRTCGQCAPVAIGVALERRPHPRGGRIQRNPAAESPLLSSRPLTPAESNAYEAGLVTPEELWAAGGERRHARPAYRSSRSPGPAAQQQSVMCDHPTCLTFFAATSSKREYCELHMKWNRNRLKRARERLPRKHEAFQFQLVQDVGGVTFPRKDGSSVRIEDHAPRYARDEEELVQFAEFVAAGTMQTVVGP